MIRSFLLVLLLLGTCRGWSQTGAERSALRALAKDKWEKARSILQKALRKDSTRTASYYAMARYFFSKQNPSFNVDSAHHFIDVAVEHFSGYGPDEKSKLLRLPLDSAILQQMRQRIDSAAFMRARRANTEVAFTFFIENFPEADQFPDAVSLRDEAAYLDALKENTPAALKNFLTKYPHTRHTAEAGALYEKLLFESQTEDQRLSSFESFVAAHPDSPYRSQAEEEVFEISTAGGDPAAFWEFLRTYPDARAGKKARDILFHLLPETDTHPFSELVRSDSLSHIEHLNEGYLIPFFADGKFGFMDADGREVIPASDDELYDDYRCGNIREDILVQHGHIISRNGAVIFRGDVEAFEDLGCGFLGVETSGCYRIVHKSGFVVGTGCAQGAMVIEGRFIAIQKNDLWDLYSLSGRMLSPGWDEIKAFHTLFGLLKNGRWFLATAQQLGAVADQQYLYFDQGFDEVREWPNDLIWVKRSQSEAVLDSVLTMKIPFDSHRLTPEKFGVRSTSSAGIKLFNEAFDASACFEEVRIGTNWICAKSGNGWGFFKPATWSLAENKYDSISFVGVFAAAYHEDSVRVFFDESTSHDFNAAKLKFIPSRDSTAFLLVEERNRKSVYDNKGRKLFEGNYDGIQYAGKFHFIVSRREKKGLIDASGRQVLPIAYDAIGDADELRVPLLRGMKFGLFDLETKRVVSPAYDKNLKAYNKDLIAAFRHGKWGFIDFREKIRLPFEFDEVKYWNDSSALVKRIGKWQILDLQSNTVLVDEIRSYKTIRASDQEFVAIVRCGNEYGVLSSLRGVVIPIRFTDIVNVGSSEKPLYFTEKHVEEAYLFVAIYYDEHGRSIRSQAFKPEEYDKIYCSNN